MKDEQYIEDLIAKKLAGEITPAEDVVLNEWLQNADNRKYYASLEQIFNEAPSIKEEQEVDTDAAWNKLKKQIHKKQSGDAKVIPLRRNYFLRIAAAIIVIAGAGIALYINRSRINTTEFHYATLSSPALFTLPDSSTIFLNKNSIADVTITDKERKTVLKGEGFFTVVHNEQQPFVVEAAGLEIRDIGTAFNVDATDSVNVDVVVEHGEVALITKSKTVNARKGERVIYNKSQASLTPVSALDPNTLSYSTKIFVFENTSLPAVIEKLNEVYDSNISINDNLKFCRLTSTFRNEKIDYIVQVIAETLQLRIVKDGNRVLLEGNGCSE